MNIKVLFLDLKNNDEIFVSYDIPNMIREATSDNSSQTSQRYINPRIRVNNDYFLRLRKKEKLKKIIIVLGVILIISIILIFIFFLKKILNSQEENYLKEKLITNIKYSPNILFRFSGIQNSKVIVKGDKVSEENSTHEFPKSTDFIFIVRESHFEINKTTSIGKNWYTGYIGILNLIVQNETHDNTLIFDKTLNEYLGNSNIDIKSLNKPNVKYVNDNGHYCFAKIEFYQNGEIKNYYLPNGFNISEFNYIEEISKLLIPKISSNLYSESIEDILNDFSEVNEKNKNENNTIYNENEQIENIGRNLNKKDV